MNHFLLLYMPPSTFMSFYLKFLFVLSPPLFSSLFW